MTTIKGDMILIMRERVETNKTLRTENDQQ